MDSLTKRKTQICVASFLILLHLAVIVHAIYDPSATTTKPAIRRESVIPWYLNEGNSKPPDDSPELPQSDDRPSVTCPFKILCDLRKPKKHNIEQRREIESGFDQKTSGQYPSTRDDESLVDEPMEEPSNFDGSNPYANPYEKNHHAASSQSWDLYEGVPVDSKKPRQEKILHPTNVIQKVTVAKYDEYSGVQCPDSTATGQFVYPLDCKFFVNCWQGRAFVQPCAPGTLFNPDTLECDFPHKVRCYGGEIADFARSNFREDTERLEIFVKQPNPSYNDDRFIKNVQDYPGSLHPDRIHRSVSPYPGDCTKFLKSDKTGSFILSCDRGTVFNPEIGGCDWPQKVKGCEDVFKNNGNSRSIAFTPSMVKMYDRYGKNQYGQDSWKPTNNQPRATKKPTCSKDFTGYVPHPDTCYKFLQCDRGTTYIKDCGPGTAFNPKISTCDWPYNVPACSNDQTHRPTEDLTTTTESPAVVEVPTGNPITGEGNRLWNLPNVTFIKEVVWVPNTYVENGSHDLNRPTASNPVHGNQNFPHKEHGYHNNRDYTKKYDNESKNKIGSQTKPQNSTADRNNYGGTNRQFGYNYQPGQWQPMPNNPSRPYQSQPRDTESDEIIGQSSYDHKQYHNNHNNHHHPYHRHHYNPHRDDGSGGWDHREHHHHQSESDDEGISQVSSTFDSDPSSWNPTPNYHQPPRNQDGHPHNHHQHHNPSYAHNNSHGNGYWNIEVQESKSDSPINKNSSNDRSSYGRTNTDFTNTGQQNSNDGTGNKFYGSWKPSTATTTSRTIGTKWFVPDPRPTWNYGTGTPRDNDRMRPSQLDPLDRHQPGVFVPSTWRGQDWTESTGQDPKPTPFVPPEIEWNQGIGQIEYVRIIVCRSAGFINMQWAGTLGRPLDKKLDDWLPKTNVLQKGDSRKDIDSKLDDWTSKTNIFNAQQGNKFQGVKTTVKDPGRVGPSGIYVTVNGTKGHYITRDLEINQGHSNTKSYGQDGAHGPPIINTSYNNSFPHGTPWLTRWKVPVNPTYASKYEPIQKPIPINSLNSTQSKPSMNYNPNYEQYPTRQKTTPAISSISTTENPGFGFDPPNKRTANRNSRTNSGFDVPTVSIEEDYRGNKYGSGNGKGEEIVNFAEVVEPDIDKYNVDVLDDKKSWKPQLAFENKTKKSNDNSVIMSISKTKKKKVDLEILDVKLAPWHEDEPPFPVYYIAPVHPLGYTPKSTKMTPTTGQILRLRGGSSPRDGYLEVQGIQPGWGVVCDSRNGWSLNEAHVVCRQLGYTRGAEMAWQGRSHWDEDEIPWIGATEVNCKGNETRFQTCKFVHGEDCLINRNAVGVRCMPNRIAHCRTDEVPHNGQCYHLANPDSGLNHAEALDYCANRKSQLIDITTQAEHDFLSEWLMQSYPNVVSVMTSGVGFTTFNRTLWLWEDSARAKFQFTKWWPGWMEDKKNPPFAGSRPVCVVMKKEFPCKDRPETNCTTDYFFWDIEDCASSMKGHSYVCERPYDDISCVYGKGQQYAGNASVSSSGRECLPWNDETLIHALRVNVLNKEVRDKLKTHNYCRNPNPIKESRPWCFVEAYGERDYCDIPACGKIGTKKSVAGGQCKPKHFECMPGECIPSPWVCDGDEDCTNGLDEKACSTHLGFFEKIDKHKLEGHDIEKWLNTPAKTCALRCKEADFTCRSFSHKSDGNVCLLSDANVGGSGDLLPSEDFDYYEMIDRSTNCEGMYVCGNRKCVNQTKVCDGKNDCGDRTDENICTVENLDYDIRLAGSNNSHEGRLEVKVLGHWGQVCDDGFGKIDADVVCKELGFSLGALEVRPSAYYGNSDPPDRFMVDQLKCRGNETSLRECDFDGWGVHNCLPEEAVGVVCKSAVNTCQLGHWKCDDSPVCIPTQFICDEVIDCPGGSDESSVHCDAPFELRLANGSSLLEGRVEVRHHGVWGTVCDDDFSNAAAKVICRSLGYGGSAIAKKNGFFGPGEGPIWLDEVFCHGNEPQLYKCEHNHWGRHNCDHDEDAGVICTEGAITDIELESETTVLPEININDLLPSDCGKRAEDFGGGDDEIFARVVRGSIAPKGSYPWQASIRVRGHSRSNHWCGAVVLSPLHVLTAAHCLEGYNKGTYFVRAGDYNSEIDEGTEVEANIEDYYVHEEFRQGQRMNNDIALVLLKGHGIPLGEHVMPICLPPSNAEYSPGLNCTISGFGSIETGRSAQSLNLRYGWVPLIDQSVCRAEYVYGEGKISDGMICAGYLDEGTDACDGDSGGPLACQKNGAFTLYGVTSWGHHCGEANKPGVYVRVAHYRDWIERKIRESLFGR